MKFSNVTWWTGTRVYVSLSTDYRRQVDGLCGDFDGTFSNDLSLGGVGVSPEEFGRQWKTSLSCPDHIESFEEFPCGVTHVTDLYRIEPSIS
jgi:hypothetical protein